MALKNIQHIPTIKTNLDDPTYQQESIQGDAAHLIRETLARNDIPFEKFQQTLQDGIEGSKGALGLEAAQAMLCKQFPQLEGKIGNLAQRLCDVTPKVLSTDEVEIEFISTVELPVDRGTARRWTVDPLTAFLDLAENCKGVLVENESACNRNGNPLAIAMIQRGDEPFIQDLSNLGFDFSGYRTDRNSDKPMTHDEAVKGLEDLTLNYEVDKHLIDGTQPDESLYDFGSVVRLTALDETGNIIGVATVKPKNVDRTNFRRAGQTIRTVLAEGVDNTRPLVDESRVRVEPRLIASPEQRNEVLAAGANVPRQFFKANASIDTQAITEPGAGIELEIGTAVVAADTIPFSGTTNLAANKGVQANNIQNSIAGTTLGQMMGQNAQIRVEGTDRNGTPKGDGTPIQKKLLQLALPQRDSVTIGGLAMSSIPYNNVGSEITAPEGADLREHLGELGLDVIQKKIKGSTDQNFELTVKPSFLKGGKNLKVAVGYEMPDGKWMWSNDKEGRSSTEPDLKSASKSASFTVRVPDSVYRQGDTNTPAPLRIRVYDASTPGGTPMYMGAASIDMKEIDRAPSQYSTPEQMWQTIKEAQTTFDQAKKAALQQGMVIAEPIGVEALHDKLEAGETFEFSYKNQNFGIEMNVEKHGVEHAVIVNANGDALNNGANAVLYASTDDNVPNGHFAISLMGIGGNANQAMYISKEDNSARIAPFPLPAQQTSETSSLREIRREALMAKNGDNDVYPDMLFKGVEIHDRNINSQEDLDALLTELKAARTEALKDLAAQKQGAGDTEQKA